MIERLKIISLTIRKHIKLCLLFSLGFTLFYYALLMLSLIVRFGDLPNYINFYDWFGHVKTILASTPSFKDSLLIIKDEWLLEIGFMNYDFGAGISEWSLFFAPAKMLGVAVLGFFIVTYYLVAKENKSVCKINKSTTATAGLGGTLVGLASITMSWVVCCSTPTWVVGLAMMGLGVSTSLWLEPLGFTVNALGFLLLIIATLVAAKGSSRIQSVQTSPS